jgi:hypothetical protein
MDADQLPAGTLAVRRGFTSLASSLRVFLQERLDA